MAQQSERLPDLPCCDPMLLCCVCERLLDNPQLLRCLHSCCQSCLQPSGACAMDEHQATAKPTCPVCQEASSDVTCNDFIGSRVSRYITIAKSSLCGKCADTGDAHQQAAAWCTSCRMSFCETCLSSPSCVHKTHSTTRIEEVKSFDEVFPLPAPVCSSHQKPYDFVCFSCKTCCCADCWPSCSKHDMQHISDPIVASYVANARSDVANLARMLLSKADVLSKRKQIAAALEIDRQNDLQKLKNSKLRLLKVIYDVYVTVETRLKDTYDGLKATADAILRSSEAMEHKVSQAAKYSCYVVDVGLSSELLMQEQSLLSRMKSLCTDLDELRQPLEAGQYVTFDSTLPDDETQLVDLVTSWMGLPRAKTDDLCVRKSQPETSFVSSNAESTEKAPREAEDFASYIETKGLGEIMYELRRRLDELENVRLKVAVIGCSGSGKSTFINTLRSFRQLPRQLPRAARTGVIETTKEPTPYEHSDYPNVQFWDLPGMGTREFPKKTYLQQIHFDTYDFFIIVCATRVTEHETWLAQEIQSADKHFYFLRSRIDIDVRNNECDYPETHDEQKLLQEMRDNCIEELEKAGIQNPSVFLVCKNPYLYDFREFQMKAISDLPELKGEKLLYIARTNSVERIKQITKKLQERSRRVAVVSATVAAIPFLGLSTEFEISAILKELAFYKKQYRLDDKGLKELSETGHGSEQVLKNAKDKHFWFPLTPASLERALASAGVVEAGFSARDVIKYVPLIGSGASAGLSFASTSVFLSTVIASMEETALALHAAAFTKRL